MAHGGSEPPSGPFLRPAPCGRCDDAPAARSRTARYCYLFDVDEGLASGLDHRMRLVARPMAAARLQELSVGEFELVPLLAQLGRGLGLLVVDGVIALDVQVGDRVASELVGAGDLLAPWVGEDDVVLLASETFTRALVRTRVAVLDEAFADRIRPWPQIHCALLRRAVRRAMELNVHRAATCHPRADARIALLLWHLAERWGRVEPDGILLPLPLTHRLIGQLVGAERPSVSHALARLARAGLLTRKQNGIVLHGTAAHHIAHLVERGDETAAQA
jgi:CRP/FNR family cyclic AMP-dependent transcriptional regulator